MVENHRPLVILDDELAKISEAIATARKNPYRWEDIKPQALPIEPVLYLADRKKGRVFPGVPVLLPTGYRATISFEYQPDGLYRHLGISVEDPDSLPHPLAIRMIAEAFGFIGKPDRGWVEEFRPGHYAVHVIARELTEWPAET